MFLTETDMTTHDAGSGIQALEIARTGTPLSEQIEGYIERRACGRIRDLQVVCFEGRVILKGRSRTYHAKQLAQEAAMDCTEGTFALANHIIVA